MKREKYIITLPEPCSESWDAITPAGKGSHCAGGRAWHYLKITTVRGTGSGCDQEAERLVKAVPPG